jgi:hypothetical protein
MKEEDAILPDDERQRCEVWTRVMGYHRPVASFNPGKRREFEERLPFFDAAYQEQPNGVANRPIAAAKKGEHEH